VQALIYWSVASFLRLVTRLFFRTIEVVGRDHIPPAGPTIFVGNHPNSLVDPVMILSTAPRRVSLAARDGLFRMPHLRPLLWAMGAVSIRRRQDQASAEPAVDNGEAFAALRRVLAAGGAFGIFPEGVTYTDSELQPLKTGAARIALSAVAEGVPVVLVPVGLSYRRRDRFRGRVLVQYGRPIALAGWVAERGAQATPRALTADIEVALRALTINASDFDTLRVLDGVRRLYVPEERDLSLADEAEITRRLVEHWERKQEVPEVRALYRDVEGYLGVLEALGLADWDLRRPLRRLGWTLRVARHAALLLVALPLAVPGLALHAPVLFVATRAGELLIARDDVKATYRMMVATTLVLGTYALVGAGLVAADPSVAGALRAGSVLGLLALSGLAAIRVLERQYVIRHGLAVLAHVLALKDQLAALRAERDALRRRIVALAGIHADPSLARIVPQDELVAAQRPPSPEGGRGGGRPGAP
jgi:glycerol-3-phosphate O-acyltransferase/dihydroxyacetone phosphate acyltransferase